MAEDKVGAFGKLLYKLMNDQKEFDAFRECATAATTRSGIDKAQTNALIKRDAKAIDELFASENPNVTNGGNPNHIRGSKLVTKLNDPGA